MTRKIVPEMTYNVSRGTLNPTITWQQPHWLNTQQSPDYSQHYQTMMLPV